MPALVVGSAPELELDPELPLKPDPELPLELDPELVLEPEPELEPEPDPELVLEPELPPEPAPPVEAKCCGMPQDARLRRNETVKMEMKAFITVSPSF